MGGLCRRRRAESGKRARHEGREASDFTQWTTASDLKSLRYYYRSYNDQKLRMVRLAGLDLTGGKIWHLPVHDARPTFVDETAKLGN